MSGFFFVVAQVACWKTSKKKQTVLQSSIEVDQVTGLRKIHWW